MIVDVIDGAVHIFPVDRRNEVMQRMAVVRTPGSIHGEYGSYDLVLRVLVNVILNSNSFQLRARIDTGASVSCITADAAKRISAPVRQIGILRGAMAEAPANIYVAALGFDSGVLIHGVSLFEMAAGYINDTDIIIGMDLISLGNLTVRSNGTFTLEFH